MFFMKNPNGKNIFESHRISYLHNVAAVQAVQIF